MSSPSGPSLISSPFAFFNEKNGVCRSFWDTLTVAPSGSGIIIPAVAGAIAIITSTVISVSKDTQVTALSTVSVNKGLGDKWMLANTSIIMPFNLQGWGRSVRGEGITFAEVLGSADASIQCSWVYSLSTDGE